jgi:NAD(P)-dependent dehydrogenase (short-subunit alcohol dehydrogenase family)
MSRKVAFITGASRGIGKACAIDLAEAGYDIAITARTVTEGEQREHSPTVKRSDTSALPGSLDSTAALVEQKGVKAMSVQADLLEPHTLGAAVNKVLERWGRIDVIVHNGRYIGPGHMDKFLDTPIDLIRRQIEGNAIAPLVINQVALPAMIAQGGGAVVNITSSSGYSSPPKAAGDGGWSLGYGMSKGAMHRIAGILKGEVGHHGIRFFNVQPGFISTERIAQDMAKFGFDASKGAPPLVVGKVVTWLCTSPEAAEFDGVNIEAQQFCHERGLLPGWAGPGPLSDNGTVYDLSGYNVLQYVKRG